MELMVVVIVVVVIVVAEVVVEDQRDVTGVNHGMEETKRL